MSILRRVRARRGPWRRAHLYSRAGGRGVSSEARQILPTCPAALAGRAPVRRRAEAAPQLLKWFARKGLQAGSGSGAPVAAALAGSERAPSAPFESGCAMRIDSIDHGAPAPQRCAPPRRASNQARKGASRGARKGPAFRVPPQGHGAGAAGAPRAARERREADAPAGRADRPERGGPSRAFRAC